VSRLFGNAVHAAFIVPDIKAAMQEVIDDGIGPFYLMDHITPDASYRGTRNNPCISAAFVNSGDMQLEFIQPHDDTPSAFREFLARKPEGGLHHIAYWVDDIGEAVKSAEAKGYRFNTVQEFVNPDGSAYEIYLEPVGKPDAKLIQIMVDSPVKAFFANVRMAAENWDGSEPVRDALDLLGPEMDLKRS
jgi:catechol 2,3-dioxygenase-like lactoylglutathione lyase family enzyme